jgi:hypothetical protein
MAGTPFGYIYHLLNYGIFIGKNATIQSRTRFSPNNKTLFFNSWQLIFNNLVVFVEELLDFANKLMATKLLFNMNRSISEFDILRMDDPSNYNAGHYFLLEETGGT